MAELIASCLIGLVIGFGWGGSSAHNMVATECERLGAFFVGKKVYECKLKEEVK